ncbi:MAG: tetratricopeptide repeat protein, partial [Gemmatimonadota bacterium]
MLLARQVSHKNVVRIHDIGEHEGMRFLTMRFIEGRSVREILEREGPLAHGRAAAIVRQVAEGLEQAHAADVIHRDLKPGNILVDAAGNAYITDFGVARSLTRDGLTRAGAVVGTPDYLSPEQVAGDPVDGRSDLYALGIVLYEMLTGQLPFRGGSQAEILAQRLAGRPRDPADTGISVPAKLRAILRRTMERNPQRRYQTARELIEDLDRAGVPRPAARSLRSAVVVSTAVLALAGAWALWQSARKPAPSLPPSEPEPALHAVAVLPLEDATARPELAWASTGIPEMLAAELAEARRLRVMDSLRVLRGLRDLRLEEGRYDESALRQLAGLWNVDSLITGSVRRAGSSLRLDLRLHRMQAGGELATRYVGASAPAPEGLFGLVPRLAGELRDALGLAAKESAEPPEPGTSSIAAARAYQEGRSRLLVGDEIAAAPALERAVAADGRYAAALERLAETYQSLGHQEKAAAACERALRILGPSRSRLAHRARARLALVRGNPREAEGHYRELVRRYPSDTEPLLDLAAAQGAQGHHTEAIATLTRVTELDPKDPRGWLLLGRSATITGEGTRALQDYLLRALALQTQLHNEKGRADVLAAMGAAHQKLADFGKALENYTAAAEIQTRLGDDRGIATTMRSRSQIYQAMGRLRDAEGDLQRALSLFEKIGDSRGLSGAWNAFGVIEEARGAYAPALEAYRKALKIRRTLGDERLLAQSYDNVGYILYLQGEYDNALVYWQQALDLRRRIGEKGGIVLSVQNLGFLQTAQGRWDEAVRSFLEALEMSREINLKDATAISLGNLGVLYGLRGRASAALESLEAGIAAARAIDFKTATTEFALKKAAILLELNRGDEAASLLAQAQMWVRETENREQAADVQVLQGRLQLLRGDRSGARQAFARALPLARESGSKVSLLNARIASGAAAAGAGVAAL